jgi:site-specific DNA recombinase
VVPYGYRVVGKKKQARLVVSETLIPGLEISEAEVVCTIYRLLADEGWSCVKIAEHLNALGVPTSYTTLQRPMRRTRPDGMPSDPAPTAGVWMYGRIRNLVVNPVYKGEHHFGKRSKKTRDVIVRAVPAIVGAETWTRAQQRLRCNMLLATRNAKRQYLLRGLITSGICGLSFGGKQVGRASGTVHHYYACGGKHQARSRVHGKCPSNFLPAQQLEDTIWQDILGFLHNPGPVLTQLADQVQSRQAQTQDLEQERLTTALALSHKDAEKEQMLDLYRRGRITVSDLERQLEKIAEEAAELKGRLSALETRLQGQEAIAARLLDARSLLESLRARLKAEFTWQEKRALVEALVLDIRVDHPLQITVTYAFDGSTTTRTNCNAATARPA